MTLMPISTFVKLDRKRCERVKLCSALEAPQHMPVNDADYRKPVKLPEARQKPSLEPVVDKGEYIEPIRLSKRRFALAFYYEPTKRPPVFNEMLPDIERLIHSVAQRFSDNSSSHLNLTDMIGEGRLKLAMLLEKGELLRQPTRSNFFKFLKASLQNHAKSRVQKYAFTEKRTGVKPPPRNEMFLEKPAEESAEEPLRQKQVEVSLDNTDLHLQVADEGHDAQAWKEVLEEYATILNVREREVLYQLAQPNEDALNAAYLDAHYKKLPGKITVKVKHHHLALGLLLTDEYFEQLVLSIRNKVQAYRAMNDNEQLEKARYNAVIAQLKTVFGVQIPPTADDMMIKRLFTLAARDQYTKLNPQVAEMLDTVGAKVPRLHKDMISCYGVLYQDTARQCQSCGLKNSCYTEAANLGLTKITIAPRLLGSRQQRSPVIFPQMEGDTSAAGSYDEAEILSYLDEFFTPFKRKDEIYYGHDAETAERQVLLFCLGTQTTPLKLRFCVPSEALKKKLVSVAKCWYPPSDATTAEVTALIDQHAKETLDA